nr:hypothetical protein CFP56_25512 [Quercus suber]
MRGHERAKQRTSQRLKSIQEDLTQLYGEFISYWLLADALRTITKGNKFKGACFFKPSCQQLTIDISNMTGCITSGFDQPLRQSKIVRKPQSDIRVILWEELNLAAILQELACCAGEGEALFERS